MSQIKSQVCGWVEQGHITQEQANTLYRQVTVLPDASSWRGLIANLLLWFGALSFASGVIFFFAYNWQSLGRFAKFGLIEVAIVLAIGAFAWLYYRANSLSTASHSLRHSHSNYSNQSNDSRFGATTANGVLLAASVLVGGLLALVGQTYQTGADPWQLFALWALVVLPFAWVAGFDGLWLLLVGLINLSIGIFLDSFSHLWGAFLDEQGQLLIFICLNLAIYYAFVFLDRNVVGRWHAPILEYACSLFAMGCFTWLITWLIFDDFFKGDGFSTGVISGYLAHLVLGFVIFRYRLPRIYPLALGGFSLIAVGAALLIRLMFEDNDPIGGFLFIGLYIILASTGLSIWLKELSRKLKPLSESELEPAARATQGKVGDIHEQQ
ncbi:DUF2157 domain-containing protein [Shewanella baltica]|uniref:DUF2157 domain-containing protein n=1 Tax=Shewanella baltica TaxID=62322 RepID=UPI0028721807|nr:DUF2157 domain-containing protein [Shewanella baltica]MDR9767336.1 DUF2157 domain-containing protein [Shewanella baltica]